MKTRILLALLVFSITFQLMAQEKIQWKPEMTEQWEPQPAKVTSEPNTAPSDAVVLFDGKNLAEWEAVKGGDAGWTVENGIMTVKPGTGDIQTKGSFGDVQLHIEWRSPEKIEGQGQGRGNSGIFLQKRYELQVLDSYNNRTYSNGQAGSIYKQHMPLVNASRKPGEWQIYDIIYTAPVFSENGTLKYPARMTVLHNGVLIQNNVAIEGNTEYIGLPKYVSHGEDKIVLQDHSNPVSYRNIWLRKLN